MKKKNKFLYIDTDSIRTDCYHGGFTYVNQDSKNDYRKIVDVDITDFWLHPIDFTNTKTKKVTKFKAFFKRHRKTLLKAVTAVLMFAGLIILFKFLNAVANGWRGYTGVGGEVFVFLLIFAPALIVKLRDSVHDFIDLFFRHK